MLTKQKRKRIKKSWARKPAGMAAKERQKRKPGNSVVENLPPQNGKARDMVGKAIGVSGKTIDHRPITIIGRDQAGNVVAQDRTDSNWKANQIAAAWKASGLAVEVIETEAPSEVELAGLTGQGSPSGEVLGHPEASVGA